MTSQHTARPKPTEDRLWGDVQTSLGGSVWRTLLPLLRGEKRSTNRLGDDEIAQLRRLYSFARPYRGRLALGIGAAVSGSLVALAAPLAWRYLVDAIVPGGNPQLLSTVTVALIGIYVLAGSIRLWSSYLLNVVGLRVTTDLRLELYEHFQSLPLSFFAARRTGELVSRVMNDVSAVAGVVTGDLAGLLRHVVFFVGALILILVTDWRLTLFTFLMIPAVSLISLLLGRAVRRLSTALTDESAAVTTVLEESLSSVRTVRSFVREQYEIGRFRHRLVELLALALRRMSLEILFGPLLSILFLSSTVLIIWFGGKQVLAGELSAGQLVTFIVLTTSIGGSIRFVGELWTRLQSALGVCERIFALLDFESDLVDAPDAITLPTLVGRVSFDHVSFAYPSNEPDFEPPTVLDDISIDVEPGETLALVGPSGAGKTTLINLVLRFYDPTDGHLRVDGFELRSVTVESLRGQIGLVPQETQLFGGTVRENILYGKLNASDEELDAASRAANAEEFIAQLPQGYDTIIGERGVRLSGGQRQRLAIARALLKDPRILLLDEATSALDNESEYLVQEALQRLMAGRTTLVIAHRLSTVKNASRIAVIQAGRLTELGTHQELIDLDGLYARLYRHQFKELDSPFAAGPTRQALSSAALAPQINEPET